MDFEATGDVKDSSTWEIVEFPCVIVNVSERKIVETKDWTFRQYVRPTRHAKLSETCTSVTGITQDQVDKAQPIENVLSEFYNWVSSKNLGKFAVVTCGDYDMNTALYWEIQHKKMPPPPEYLRSWINIKIPFCEQILKNNVPKGKSPSIGMAGMLKKLGLSLDGRHHCGIDDCKNIAKIVVKLLELGCVLKITGTRVYGATLATTSTSTSTQEIGTSINTVQFPSPTISTLTTTTSAHTSTDVTTTNSARGRGNSRIQRGARGRGRGVKL